MKDMYIGGIFARQSQEYEWFEKAVYIQLNIAWKNDVC